MSVLVFYLLLLGAPLLYLAIRSAFREGRSQLGRERARTFELDDETARLLADHRALTVRSTAASDGLVHVRAPGIPVFLQMGPSLECSGQSSEPRLDFETILRLLPSEQQTAVQRFFERYPVELRAGELHCDLASLLSSVVTAPREVVATFVREAADVTCALSALDELVPTWLHYHCRHEPEGLKRLHWFHLLEQHFPSSFHLQALVEDAWRRAASDDLLVVLPRLAADQRERLASSLRPEQVDVELWCARLDELERSLSREALVQLLQRSLLMAPRAALLNLKRLSALEALPSTSRLAELARQHRDPEMIIALVDAVCAQPSPEAESLLLDLLAEEVPRSQGDRPTALSVSLLGHLGGVGTTRAVPRLRAIHQQTDPLGSLAGSLTLAIAQIQDRIGAHSGGRLAVAEQAEAGSLAMSEQEGALALAGGLPVPGSSKPPRD